MIFCFTTKRHRFARGRAVESTVHPRSRPARNQARACSACRMVPRGPSNNQDAAQFSPRRRWLQLRQSSGATGSFTHRASIKPASFEPRQAGLFYVLASALQSAIIAVNRALAKARTAHQTLRSSSVRNWSLPSCLVRPWPRTTSGRKGRALAASDAPKRRFRSLRGLRREYKYVGRAAQRARKAR